MAEWADTDGEVLRLALQGSGDGAWDWDLFSGTLRLSAAAIQLIGHPATGGLAGWLEMVRPEDRAGFEAALGRHLSGGSERLEHEMRMTHAAQGELWVLVRGQAVLNDAGRAVRMSGLLTDITHRKRAELHLLHDAFHDELTGLANKALLLDRTGQAIDRRRRPEDAQVALLVLDIDLFRQINDRFGVVAGDNILREVSARMQDARRLGDTVARLSADEFAVLMDGVIDFQAALSAADRLVESMASEILVNGTAVRLTASIGIALSGTGYSSPADMLRDAQAAMMRAKAGGRDRVEVFDEALRESARTRLRTESDLRVALERGEFAIHYQPIVDLRTEMLAGFEALIRWQHPERGLIEPGDFIPLAEQMGLILPIGRWVLTEAARQAATWQKRYNPALFISVNVSSRQFLDDDIVALVDRTLADTGIRPATLKLEITESMLIDDPLRCVAVMQAIKDRGVCLSLDDFGTGFSSLSYLNRYPIDTLKIDRSFVKATSGGERRAAIARTITHLAQAMQMDVVAEGIERETELAFLRGLHCQFGQGFYFSHPLPADAAEQRIAAEE